MKIKYYLILALAASLSACKSDKKETIEIDMAENEISNVEITPVEHASMVLSYHGKTIYVDPTGGLEAYETFPKADYILITDIHSDHLHLNTIEALNLSNTKIIAPEAVYEQLPKNIRSITTTMINGAKEEFETFNIEAIPMYNLREEALHFHPKGRGNGYVLTFGKQRVYISGDTEDIPEMRALKNIDKAFICMNLPYTMTVESAADAVLSFKPKQVYPYHYRGTEGLSDVGAFKDIVNKKNNKIEVVQLDWYSNN